MNVNTVYNDVYKHVVLQL